MAEYTEDTAVWPAMVSLSQCLCEEMEKAGLTAKCYCGMLPGQQVAWEYPDGQAWVRLVGAFPSTQFPNQVSRVVGSCYAPLAISLEVGILRCAPLPKRAGETITPAQQFEAVRLQTADMAVMRRAIQCCFKGSDVLLGNYSPLGPNGGMVGGTWQVYIGEDWEN